MLLVDDQELMRMGFRMVMESQTDMEVVGEAGNGREAIDAGAPHATRTSSSWTSGCPGSTASRRPG